MKRCFNIKYFAVMREKNVFSVFLLNECLLLFVCILCSISSAENKNLCEVYYHTLPELGVVKKIKIFCDSFNDTYNTEGTDYQILKIVCADEKTTGLIKPPQISSYGEQMILKNCPLRAGFFENSHLKGIREFESLHRSNPVLMNNFFKGACSIEIILLSANSIESIEPKAFDCVKNITRLELSRNRFSFLPVGVFRDMQYLKYLNLSNNTLSSLPHDVFRDKQHLRYLDLSNNTLRSISSHIFKGLLSLAYLYLSNNKLSYLSSEIFRDTQYLKYLDLSRNSLSTILSFNKLHHLRNVFEINKQLNENPLNDSDALILRGDSSINLSKLDKQHFGNNNKTFFPNNFLIHNLSRFVTVENKLESNHSEIFSDLRYMRYLNLAYNNISTIEGKPFKHNAVLNKLYLHGNNILIVKGGIFEGLSSLKELNLCKNRIVNIDKSFTELIKLRKLHLCDNFISSMHTSEPSASPFSTLENLEFLFLNQNEIKNFTNVIHNNRNLLHLQLDNNNIKSLDNVFITNHKLIELALGGNSELALTSDAFRGLSSLKTLNIVLCQITNIPRDIFLNTKTLSTLRLSGNNLQEIDSDTFYGLENLTELDVGENEIFALVDQPFKHTQNLISIIISQNNISELKDDMFQGLSWLRYLDVSRNAIGKIEDNTFKPLGDLKFLNISHNLILSLNSIMNGISGHNLSEIDFSYNNLTNIRHKNWSKLSGLEIIRVTNNKISSLILSDVSIEVINLKNYNINRIYSDEVSDIPFQKSLGGAQIFLRGNPIECDCYAFGIYKYLKDNASQSVRLMDDLICQYPLNHRDRNILNLKPNDFICNISEFCPQNCDCTYRSYDRAVILNCSDKDYEHLPLIAPYNTNLLDVTRNKLISLLQLNEKIWENLTEVYADGNRIINEDFHIPNNLKYLSISDNRFKQLPKSVQKHATIMKDFKITLSGNLWPCDCSVLPFKTFLSDHSTQIADVSQVRCVFPGSAVHTTVLRKMKFSDLCPHFKSGDVIILSSVLGFIVLTLLVTTMILYCMRKIQVLSFLFTHWQPCYLWLSYDVLEKEGKRYDCFIAYSSSDHEVALSILDKLEDPDSCKFCIHERDWLGGRFITENIADSIQNSRKTLIILSETFLKSQWFQVEFQATYYQMLKDRKNRLILVLKGELPDKNKLDKDLQFVISTKSYLEWGERWFWEKLRYLIHTDSNFTESAQGNGFRGILSCLKTYNVNTEEIRLDELN